MRNSLERELKNLDFKDQLINQIYQYAVFGTSKRIRPMLLLEFVNLFHGDQAEAMPFAVAMECIHNYSLIHDDLPCMDNDQYRRGKLSVFARYGEDLAVLTGDAILNKAYEILIQAVHTKRQQLAACEISICAGSQGMIRGQILDIKNKITQLYEMYDKKTCFLIKAACKAGAILGGGTKEQVKEAESYGYYVGMAFQLIDDIFDYDTDIASNKLTFATQLGVEKTRNKAIGYTERANNILDSYGNASKLKKITSDLLNRKY